jgi:competence protein ComEC
VRFDMLHPTRESYSADRLKDNDRSCVLKVSSPYGSLLLTGDMERASEMELLERNAASISADVLVVPHHGSKTSSTQPFVDRVQPKVTVFTVGYRNRFGHPKADVVERYRALDSTIYRSDTDGALLVSFAAGQEASVQAWRRVRPRYWQNAEWDLAEPEITD